MKLGHFLIASFTGHMLLLFIFSLLYTSLKSTKVPIIEVSLIQLGGSSGGVSVRTQRLFKDIFRGGGVNYSFNPEDNNRGASKIQRQYKEPAYAPTSSILDKEGELSSAGREKITDKSRGSISLSKKGSSLPSGSEAVGYIGSKLGVAGQVASREIIYFEKPVYPEWAKKKGIEAVVELKFWVDPDGSIDEVTVLKRGYLQLDNLAVNVLKKWKFEPLPVGGERLRQWGRIRMNFDLE